MGDLLESADHRSQLLVTQMLAEERETDHVGKSNGENGALARGEAVAAGHHGALDACRHLSSPDELEDPRHGRDDDVGHAGEGVGRHDRVGLHLAADDVARGQLGVGDTGQRRAHDPGHLQRGVGVRRSQRLQPLVETDGLEVEVGESAVVVVDPGETEGPPEMLELGQIHPGELGHLEPGVPPARRDEHPLGHEEVDHPVGDGLVDLLVGGAAHDEGLADPGQGRLPGRRRVGVGVVVVGGGVAVLDVSVGHVGSPRSRVSSHSEREGRFIRFMSASLGE